MTTEVIPAGQEIEVQEPKEIEISPEGLEVAEAYLLTNSVEGAADVLNMPAHLITKQLNKREVKKYIDTVYMDLGYRNRHKLGEALDNQIDLKLEEMQESEMASEKDISDLLALAHKFRMDEMKMQLELMKIEQQAKKSSIMAGTVNNVQVNDLGGANYNSLMKALLEPK